MSLKLNTLVFLLSRWPNKIANTWHSYIEAGQSLIAQAKCITGSLEAHRQLASLVALEFPDFGVAIARVRAGSSSPSHHVVLRIHLN